MNKVKNLKVYKKCLIVVDMVNGFVREGVLHDEVIANVIDRQKEIIDDYIQNEELIIFIKDTHTENSIEKKRFGNTNHCLQGTHEAQLVDELKEYEEMNNVISIPKNSTSFMEAPLFRKVVKDLDNVTTYDVIGCCTDICVVNGTMGLANYNDEWNRDVNINVHEDAIETYGALERIKELYVGSAKLLMKQQGIQLVKKR